MPVLAVTDPDLLDVHPTPGRVGRQLDKQILRRFEVGARKPLHASGLQELVPAHMQDQPLPRLDAGLDARELGFGYLGPKRGLFVAVAKKILGLGATQRPDGAKEQDR
jgi:hypothetical protein